MKLMKAVSIAVLLGLSGVSSADLVDVSESSNTYIQNNAFQGSFDFSRQSGIPESFTLESFSVRFLFEDDNSDITGSSASTVSDGSSTNKSSAHSNCANSNGSDSNCGWYFYNYETLTTINTHENESAQVTLFGVTGSKTSTAETTYQNLGTTTSSRYVAGWDDTHYTFTTNEVENQTQSASFFIDFSITDIDDLNALTSGLMSYSLTGVGDFYLKEITASANVVANVSAPFMSFGALSLLGFLGFRKRLSSAAQG
jgi:hypothetical protein